MYGRLAVGRGRGISWLSSFVSSSSSSPRSHPVLFLPVFVLVPVLVPAAVIVCIPIVPSSPVLPCRRCLYLLSVFVAAFVIVMFTVIIIFARLRQPAVVEIARKHFGCESSLCKPTHGPICILGYSRSVLN